MTLTAAPSTAAAIDRAAFGDLDATGETWFTSVDHRRVGRLLTAASLLVGVAGTAILALVTGKADAAAREALSDGDFLGSSANGAFSFARLSNLVATGLPYFVILPLFLGVATAVVPRLIGGTRMAFPRLQAFVLWAYVAATALFIASFCVGDGPPSISITGSIFDVSTSDSVNRATDLLLASLVLVTITTLLGAMNVVVTVATQRSIGTRLDDVRPFAFASFITSGVLLLASPVFLAGLLLLSVDAHFGGSLFGGSNAHRVWNHMIWWNGRPEAFLVLLPAVGALLEIVSARVGASPLGGRAANTLMGLFGSLTLLAWSADKWKADHLIQPNSTIQTSLIAVPLLLLGLIALGTLAQNAKNLSMDSSLLYAIGSDLLVLLSVLAVIAAAVVGITEDAGKNLWQSNQTMLLMLAAPVAGLLAVAVEYIPRTADRRAHAGVASLGGLAVLAGFAVAGLAGLASSLRDEFTKSASGLSTLGSIGLLVAAAGIALAGLSIAASLLPGRSATSGSEAGH